MEKQEDGHRKATAYWLSMDMPVLEGYLCLLIVCILLVSAGEYDESNNFRTRRGHKLEIDLPARYLYRVSMYLRLIALLTHHRGHK